MRRLVVDARERGTGQRYLIQHSAGSGKSNSIAWLAHRLSTLHDDDDRRVFNSIIVITDRRVLDRQLQGAIGQFEQVEGVVENIDKTSKQLRQALEEGKTIIVTTLQKFPVIAEQIVALAGQRFAVIIDEAHSSQGGESTESVRRVLAAANLEEAETEDEETGDDLEDRITAEVKKRGPLPNVSYFAFTATPKSETMRLFGTPRPDGSYVPFSLYSMRQAIEEGFILDVLQNYTTYKTYWSLLKKIADDPRYERQRAATLLKSFVDLSDHAINRKVEIMVEHFADQVADRIGGQAKAMIVTRSRLHAVRYKLAVDRSLKERGYPFKALVAFSGSVKDPRDSEIYTERGMNTASTGQHIPETATAETFKRDEFRLLIAANKFQTGFDQPLLHTMYVDKKLRGVNAVQTLSRLNRVHLGKDETMVLDFANEADDIQRAFQPYHDRTVLPEATDPNVLYDLETRLLAAHLFTTDDVEHFARVYFAPRARQHRLHTALQPVVDRHKAAGEEEQVDFRGTLADYLRLYAFLSQVLPFADNDLLKLYEFGRLLLRKLPVSRQRLPVEIQRQIEIDAYRVHRTRLGRIALERGQSELGAVQPRQGHAPAPDEIEPLSQIIRELNDRFGTDFSPQDKVFLEQLEARLAGDTALEASVRVNPSDTARLTFDHVVNDNVQDMIDSNFKFYKQIMDDRDFAKLLFDWLFERYRKRTQENGGPSSPALER